MTSKGRPDTNKERELVTYCQCVVPQRVLIMRGGRHLPQKHLEEKCAGCFRPIKPVEVRS